MPGVPARALDRLDAMARRRPILQAPFRAAIARHARAAEADLDAWAEAVLGLANINAGATALLALLRLTAVAAPRPDALSRLAGAATVGAEICRWAGSGAVRATLEARLALGTLFQAMTAGEEAAWWRALGHLAHEAPDCVPALAESSGRLLARCGIAHVDEFVSIGLRSGADKLKRQAFFALESADARRVVDRLAGQVTFTSMQGQLRAYVAALWGKPYPVRDLPAPENDDRARRTAVSSGIILVPDVFRGVLSADAPSLYRASVAHASAHLTFGGRPFDPGSLKPIQIVLVGLIEDARIEALAMARLPGLRALWAPFHTVERSHLKTAAMILERLARGLFDPAYAEDDGIVKKGRALFAAEPDLADPDLSRRIGSLLGNDMGQMRIQFNAKQHVIEPAYRDDNLGLWTLPPPPADAALHDVEVAVQSARVERRPDSCDDPEPQNPEAGEVMGRARPMASPAERGVAIALYPEWDRAAGLEWPDWATVRDVEPRHGAPGAIDDALARELGLQRRVERLVRNARIGRPTRLRRQPDGLDLDVDAAIDAMTALRSGELPEDRIHTRKVLRSRDLAVLVLIDTSESTRDRVPAANAPVIAVERLAVAILAKAMGQLGDRFALRAFCSNGRDEVRIVRVKDFDRAFDDEAKARLAGLEPGYSTRLGTALRHAGAELDGLAATRRIVIALTDGAPADIDVTDPADLVEDARRAVLGLYNRGIDVFGITLDPSGQGAGGAVFGRSNHMPVRRIEELPSRLSELYFRIARR